MPLDAEDLRKEIGFPADGWDSEDAARAEKVLAGARRRVRAFVGPARFDRAVHTEDKAKLEAIDEATMILAIARFANPEAALQVRQSTDRSVSFGDSSDAAGGRREAREILRGAFGARAGVTTL